jgi:hypothetical protein
LKSLNDLVWVEDASKFDGVRQESDIKRGQEENLVYFFAPLNEIFLDSLELAIHIYKY